MACCLLNSCKSKNEPETPSQTEITEKAKEVAAYLTDNYAEGDSVFFRTETGETEGFGVIYNDFVELITYPELEWGEIQPKPTLTYKLTTLLESKKDTFLIQLWVSKYQKDFVYVEGGITINHSYIVDPDLATNMEGDSITILSPNIDTSCTLRKNVGLVHVHNKSLSWDLIQ
jgi:hypothetical protein